MADDNKPLKYMRYAIGEIVLVVVGILIALQINNWNNERKEIIQENQLLTELNLNLHSNIEAFNHNISSQTNAIKNIDVILDHLENIKPYNDSLGFYFRRLIFLEQITVSRSAYETLKSVGLKNIRSDSLRTEIIELFEMTYPSTINLNRDVAIQRYSVKHSMMYKYFRINRELMAVPIDYKALQHNQEFINWVYSVRAYKMAVISFNMNLVDPTSALIRQVIKRTGN